VAPERIVFTDLYPAALIASDGSRSMTLDQGRAGAIVQALFDGQTVHAVAGIGHPERFFQTLRELGLSIDVHPFADHHSYRREDFKGIDPARLIMTEKDAVKCSELLPAPFWVLRVEQQIPESLGRALLSCLEDARGSSPVPINHGRIERG
jgi:tetraacyldisaccharide 4'-kinase